MISFIVPTRGRPDRLMRMLKSVRDTVKGSYEILIYLDNDEPKLLEYLSFVDNQKDIKYFIKPRANSPVMINFLAEKSVGDIICFLCDDMTVGPVGWDVEVMKIVPEDNIFTSSAALGGGEARLIGRAGYEIVGFLLPSHMYHYYALTWFCDLYMRLGRTLIAPMECIEERLKDETSLYQIRDDYKCIQHDSNEYLTNGHKWTEEVWPKFPKYITEGR